MAAPTFIIHGFNPFEGQPAPPPAAAESGYRTLSFIPELRACTACTCRAEALQVVPGVGPLDARVMVLGQNPGEEEDRQGVPLIGASGQELDRWLKILGWRRDQILLSNVCKCHTAGNRALKPKEIDTCSTLWLARELGALPELRVIIPIGKPAASALLGKSAPPLTPLMVHHYIIRVAGREYRVFPLPHPAYLLRARQLGPYFYESILSQLNLTLRQEVPDVIAWLSQPR